MQLAIPVHGGELAADDSGGDGPPVVLVHAGWTDRSSWAGVASRLAGRCRIISYDARGFGASPPPQAPFSQVGDLVTVLDHVAVPRAILVGHSGGGATAISLAVAHPDRISALVLLAPGVQDYPWPMDDPYNTEFMALATAGDRAGLAELGLRTWAAAGPDAVARAQIEGAVAAMFAQGDFEQPDPPSYGRLDRDHRAGRGGRGGPGVPDGDPLRGQRGRPDTRLPPGRRTRFRPPDPAARA